MDKTSRIHPAAVIFDMDGLMLDTERPFIPLWAKAGKLLGWKIPPEVIVRTLGIDSEGTRAIFMEEYGPDFPYDRIRKDVSSMAHEEFDRGIAHKPGLLILLDHLASRGIPLGVATSTKRDAAVFKLDKTGILDRFAILACGDEVRNGKPAPDIFLLAAERLGTVPSQCVGFEDSPAGLRGLHRAGIPSVFVKDLVDPPEDVLSKVWRRCENLAQAAELFD